MQFSHDRAECDHVTFPVQQGGITATSSSGACSSGICVMCACCSFCTDPGWPREPTLSRLQIEGLRLWRVCALYDVPTASLDALWTMLAAHFAAPSQPETPAVKAEMSSPAAAYGGSRTSGNAGRGDGLAEEATAAQAALAREALLTAAELVCHAARYMTTLIRTVFRVTARNRSSRSEALKPCSSCLQGSAFPDVPFISHCSVRACAGTPMRQWFLQNVLQPSPGTPLSGCYSRLQLGPALLGVAVA